MKFRPMIFTVLAMLLALVSFAPAGHAALLAPGTSGAPTIFSSLPTGTVEANTGVLPFTTSAAVSGTFQEIVLLDSSTHGLDFIYSIINNSSSVDAINRTTTSVFTGDGTADNVGYVAGPGIAPVSVDRSLAGDTIGFTFATNTLLPGDGANVLVIETDATAFVPGSVFAIDGGVATIPAYAPAPEPASASLLLGGLFGLGLLVRKFRAQQS